MRTALPAAVVTAGVVLLGLASPATAAVTVAPASAACRPVPAPAADVLRATDAWEKFGVDGTGVRIGIISDSFGTYGDDVVAADIAAGWLPGPGNPCGRTSSVEVLREGTSRTTDEGRAMAQVIHGIAPGAQLVFAPTGPDTNASMVDAISDLRAAGVDIIVDDIAVEDDLRYQRGSAADAVSDAVDDGILYLSAAGNFGAAGADGYPSAGFPITSWETSFHRPMPCPDDVTAAALAVAPDRSPLDCLDFQGDEGEDPTLGVTLPQGGATSFRLDWAEPVGAVTTSFGTVARNTVTGEIRAAWADDPRIPLTRNRMSGDRTQPEEWEVSVVRHRAPGAGVPAVNLFFNDTYDGAKPIALEHYRSTRWTTVGSTMWGHQTALDTLAVAAVNAQTLTLDTYSSGGPADTRFGGSPESIAGPAVAGVDGVPISFVIGGPVEPTTFFGTSAAAPTVAAVAALVKQAAPASDPAILRGALESSARPDAFRSPWPAEIEARRFSGAGLVDAAAAVAAVSPAPQPTPSPTMTPAPNPGPASPTPAAAGPTRLAESGSNVDATVLGVGALLLALGGVVRWRRRRARS